MGLCIYRRKNEKIIENHYSDGKEFCKIENVLKSCICNKCVYHKSNTEKSVVWVTNKVLR